MTRATRHAAHEVRETGRTVRGLPVLVVGRTYDERTLDAHQYETRGPWAVTEVPANSPSVRWTVTHLPTGASVWSGRYHAHARRVLAAIDARWGADSVQEPPRLGLTPATAPVWMRQLWEALKDGTMDKVAKGRRV